MTVALDLNGEVTTADGVRYRWDANQPAASRPQNLSFRTKIGEGFSDASLQLARRIDQDYPDLNLVDTVTFTGADGSVAYEGRVSAMPRELGDRHSIGVTLAGWMAHTKDRKFQQVYVDRSMGSFGGMPLIRRAGLATGSVSTGDFSFATQEAATGTALAVAFPNRALGAQTAAETWARYTPPISVFAYQGSTTLLPAGWTVSLLATDDFSAYEIYPLTLNGTLQTQSLTTSRRNLGLQVYSNGSAATPAASAFVQFTHVAAYGTNLPTYTGETGPRGVFAADAVRDLAATTSPQLDTSGVQDTSYVIQHLAFKDRTYPYDALLEINKYHLWHLGVWEGKRLDFRPYDLTDYDWEIRTDDPGTTFSPQGPSTESLFNGIVVTFTDFDGTVNVLTPDAYPDLLDSSDGNPWNRAGVAHWDEIALSTPTLTPQALQLGRAALAERNTPKTPGTITVRGYIRDRAGTRQPVWKVRAGDAIAITNFPNDSPRLIVETSYEDTGKTMQIAVDRPFAMLEAYMDRLNNGLGD